MYSSDVIIHLSSNDPIGVLRLWANIERSVLVEALEPVAHDTNGLKKTGSSCAIPHAISCLYPVYISTNKRIITVAPVFVKKKKKVM
ncbi:hypothetical protein PoB_004068800 [Plakobranchus ocellatus]|uniref:Uncharacterized protein n=1 Tax=Plakobranchus ocellatus TaxID=259542 RepID=A0AAV4B3M5_9GAST|nr:hypothetical protein PoB_004068800 [Plakobranchus ocellatus]